MIDGVVHGITLDTLGMMQDHYDKIVDGITGYEVWKCPKCDEHVDFLEPEITMICNVSSDPDRTINEIIQEELVENGVC